MLDYPEVIVGFDETERHKLDPEPILLGLFHFDVLREDVLYIGDSPNDTMTVRATSINYTIVNRHNGINDMPCEYTYAIGFLEEILP